MKVPSVIEEARDVFDLPVRVHDDTVVTLGDVATVRRTFKDRTNYARVNGKQAISLNTLKRANANIVDTIAAVKRTVDGFRSNLPAKVSIFYSQDQAPWTLQQVTELQGNIFTALALVMIVIVAAMGLRSGIIVGLGIPVSFLFSMVPLYLLGYTFNFMVMFGMLLGLGMLIDGAIVITEYADRKMVEGFDRRSAYALAAKRMLWPVTASVATTLAAFLPLMFWPGVSGQFMRYLPVTVFTVLSGSLLYALIFGPVLGTLMGRPGSQDLRSTETLKQLEEGDPARLRSITGLYARILDFAARYAWATLALALIGVGGIFWAYGKFGQGMEFFSASESKFAIATVRARGNLAAEEINTLVSEAEDQMLHTADILDVITYTSLSGNADVGGGGFDIVGRMFIELHDENDRDRSGTEILQEIRDRTARLAGISVEIRQMQPGPGSGKPIEIEFASHDKSLLKPAVERVLAHLQHNVEGLRDIEDTRFLPGIEWKLSVDRAQAALYGADVSQVGVAVQLVTNGVKVGEYRPDRSDDAVDIRVRYPLEARGIGLLDELKVSTGQGLVPISNFVRREAVRNVDTIQRSNGIPVKYIRRRRCPGGARRHQGPASRSLACNAIFRPRPRHPVSGNQRRTRRRHGVRLCRLPAGAAVDVHSAGYPVQQLLSVDADPVRRGAVHRRRAARAAGNRKAVQRRPQRNRRGGAGGHRSKQQHRADRHLQPPAPRTSGTPLHFAYRANGSAAAAAGSAYNAHHRIRALAARQQLQHRPDQPDHRLWRHAVGAVGAALPGHRIGSSVCNAAYPGGHARHAGVAAPACSGA